MLDGKCEAIACPQSSSSAQGPAVTAKVTALIKETWCTCAMYVAQSRCAAKPVAKELGMPSAQKSQSVQTSLSSVRRVQGLCISRKATDCPRRKHTKVWDGFVGSLSSDALCKAFATAIKGFRCAVQAPVRRFNCGVMQPKRL